MSCLKKWDYYTEETLATGPSYDWAMITAKYSALDEPDQLNVLPSHGKRKIVWPCYDNINKVQPDAITSLLNVSVNWFLYVSANWLTLYSTLVQFLVFV